MARVPEWRFLTNHGLALLCIAEDPGLRMRDIAERVGVTERAAQRIVAALIKSGYVASQRIGRRNAYEVKTDLPVPDLKRSLELRDLLRLVQR